jgi:cell division protein ZapA (FtsZ GTPase activity inhibitor)
MAETPRQRRASHRELAALQAALKGQTQGEIATALNMSQAGVSKALRRATDRLGKLVPAEYAARKRQAAGRLEVLFELAMTEFIRTVDAGRPDPRWLEQARRMVADQRELHGLNAPPGGEKPGRAANPFEDVGEAELLAAARQELDQQLAQMREGEPELLAMLDGSISDVTVDAQDDDDAPALSAPIPAPPEPPPPPPAPPKVVRPVKVHVIQDPARLLAIRSRDLRGPSAWAY